ncbi:MAG: DUF1028 domain-containing protein [Anaerolineales bacterium]
MIGRSVDLYATYSIVARDPKSHDLGVAVQTHQMTVGNFVPWLEAGVGALATQALGNIRFGPMGLALLRQGIPAAKVVEALVATDDGARHRQLAVVDAKGQVAAWTGDGCIAHAGHQIGEGYSVQANMMADDTVVEAMAAAYEGAQGDLAQRMMSALRAAQSEGGDIRGMQSSALKVVRGEIPQHKEPLEWRPVYDLRVDESSDPVSELARLVRLRRAQLVDQAGHDALENDDLERALSLWAEARQLAPELEELPFWQALQLAESPDQMEQAVQILRTMLLDDPRRTHWIDLVDRVEQAGMFEREGAGADLLEALGELDGTA